MKVAKVTIKKDRSGASTKFNYPVGYDAKVIVPLLYQNEGKSTEYCLAHVPDDFIFTDDIVEVSANDADQHIDEWVGADKDLIASVEDPNSPNTEATIAFEKTRRKAVVAELAAVSAEKVLELAK